MALLSDLTTLGGFQATAVAERLALAPSLAELVGPSFRPCAELIGAKGMVAVDHVATDLRFIFVPGGRFSMGLTERDLEVVEACTDYESGVVQARLMEFEETCAPVHEVAVAPFLLATIPANYGQLMTLSAGGFGATTAMPDEALYLMELLEELRLPSEAELEYAAREGGSATFVNDAHIVWTRERRWPDVNGWGLRGMTVAAWAADEWHPNYEGAPNTSKPWTEGGPPGVYRGSLLYTPEDEDQLLFGLAAARGRLIPPEDEWDVTFRFACSLRM